MKLGPLLNCASCEVVDMLIMATSRLKFRSIQVICILVLAVLIAVFAFISAAVFANSSKGSETQGVHWKGLSTILATFTSTSLLYWGTGIFRDRAAKILKSTPTTIETKTSNSSIR